MFYKLDSSYKLAINSIEYKKEERLKDAKASSDAFKKSFVNSKYLEEVNKMVEEIDNQLKDYTANS